MALIKKLTMKHITYYYNNVALKHFHVLSTQYDITVHRVWSSQWFSIPILGTAHMFFSQAQFVNKRDIQNVQCWGSLGQELRSTGFNWHSVVMQLLNCLKKEEVLMLYCHSAHFVSRACINIASSCQIQKPEPVKLKYVSESS